MSRIKQVIVVRLLYPDGNGGTRKVRTGKLMAQVAHASLKVFLDRKVVLTGPEGQNLRVLGYTFDAPTGLNTGSLRRDERTTILDPRPLLIVHMTSEMSTWVEGTFDKIILGVDSEEDLLLIYEMAKNKDLPCALITDKGNTEFNGVPTNTTVAIGPSSEEIIDKITGPNGPVRTRLL